MSKTVSAEVIIVGGGLAGLSAAVYLGRAKRDTLVIDEDKSMARWEPVVENYLGFPEGIGGPELLQRARRQARRYGARFSHDTIHWVRSRLRHFTLRGEKGFYSCRRVLLATGIFHIPPEVPGVEPCLGHSMFFCKDCDGYRLQGKTVAIYGWGNEAVEYALGMLLYTHCVAIVTDGRQPRWSARHARWVKEYHVPVYQDPIDNVKHDGGQISELRLRCGESVIVDALFTTRGDIYYNQIARRLGAKLNSAGEVVVNVDMRTNVPGLYSAGCITPANCQMIIAAGQGATAAQAINRDLFEESLRTHSLRRFRSHQVRTRQIRPPAKRKRV